MFREARLAHWLGGYYSQRSLIAARKPPTQRPRFIPLELQYALRRAIWYTSGRFGDSLAY